MSVAVSGTLSTTETAPLISVAILKLYVSHFTFAVSRFTRSKMTTSYLFVNVNLEERWYNTNVVIFSKRWG